METVTTIHPDRLVLTAEQIRLLYPFLWVLGGSILSILLCTIKSFNPKWLVNFFICGSLIGAGLSSFRGIGIESVLLFSDMLVIDSFGSFFNLLFVACAIITVVTSFRYLDKDDIQFPEYYILILFSTFGMMLMTSAADLLIIFIAIEMMSLCVYSLVGFRRSDRKSNEASIKYFILGGAASAIFLYGVALIYGATSTTNINAIYDLIQASDSNISPLLMVGAWLVLAGFLFKVAAVPFHMWMPDVYEGAPSPVTGFMTTGLKAASFGAFCRVLVSFGFGGNFEGGFEENVKDILVVLAVATMLTGNLMALVQVSLKRMLAYSSISHTGYLLVGIIAAFNNDQDYSHVVFYLVAYSAMNLGAFVVLTFLSQKGDGGLSLHDMSGLAQKRPFLSLAMAIFLLSMAGIPPTAGFIAKYSLFFAAVQSGDTWLVVVAVLCSAIAVFYYLRVLVYMYMNEAVEARETSTGARHAIQSIWTTLAIGAMVALTLHFGIFPSKLFETVKVAVSSAIYAQ